MPESLFWFACASLVVCVLVCAGWCDWKEAEKA